mmetsp:Transcript_37494/g.111240  ORF Transcript_37494/g.111240 Transcript_37494/m.111240 type:complete len:372 (-) Transcript_37494:394-1509(-)
MEENNESVHRRDVRLRGHGEAESTARKGPKPRGRRPGLHRALHRVQYARHAGHGARDGLRHSARSGQRQREAGEAAAARRRGHRRCASPPGHGREAAATQAAHCHRGGRRVHPVRPLRRRGVPRPAPEDDKRAALGRVPQRGGRRDAGARPRGLGQEARPPVHVRHHRGHVSHGLDHAHGLPPQREARRGAPGRGRGSAGAPRARWPGVRRRRPDARPERDSRSPRPPECGAAAGAAGPRRALARERCGDQREGRRHLRRRGRPRDVRGVRRRRREVGSRGQRARRALAPDAAMDAPGPGGPGGPGGGAAGPGPGGHRRGQAGCGAEGLPRGARAVGGTAHALRRPGGPKPRLAGGEAARGPPRAGVAQRG